MRSELIIFLLPALDKDLCLHQGIQGLPIEKLIPKVPERGFNIAILRRTSRLDVESGYAKVFQPAPHRIRGEFRAIIRSNIFRCPLGKEQIVKLIQDILGPEPPGNIHGSLTQKKIQPKVEFSGLAADGRQAGESGER
jgi:hypothetical protein